MNGERPNSSGHAQPRPDYLAGEMQGGDVARGGARLIAGRHERAVGDPDGGETERPSEVEGEAGSSGMIAAGRVDDQYVGCGREAGDGRSEQRTLAQCEQALQVRTAGDAGDV
jgi:hypothetical protein